MTKLRLIVQKSRLGLSAAGPDLERSIYANGIGGRESIWSSPELEIVLEHLPGGRFAIDIEVFHGKPETQVLSDAA